MIQKYFSKIIILGNYKISGKEFKHPRRRCAICGYTVSYSNFKRHLRNAHPNEYSQCEKDPGVDFGNAFANFSHIVEDDQVTKYARHCSLR
jgi:hypothetical protein